MTASPSLSRRAVWLVLAWTVALVAVPIGLFVGESLHLLEADSFFRDPTAVAQLPYYYGWANTLGIVLWGATAGACLVPALALRRTHPFSRFFVSSLLLSVLLALDDGMLWHEEFLPARGFPEPLVYALYGTALVAWMALNRGVFAMTAYQVLIGAMGFLGASLVLDFYERAFEPLPAQVLVEDGLKFVGIGLWLAYFVVTAVMAIQPPAEVGADRARAVGRAGSR